MIILDREFWNRTRHYSHTETEDVDIKRISKGEIKTQVCIAGHMFDFNPLQEPFLRERMWRMFAHTFYTRLNLVQERLVKKIWKIKILKVKLLRMITC